MWKNMALKAWLHEDPLKRLYLDTHNHVILSTVVHAAFTSLKPQASK